MNKNTLRHIDELAQKYEVKPEIIHGLIQYEEIKILLRDYGLLKILFTYKKPIEEKAFTIISRHYRREEYKNGRNNN